MPLTRGIPLFESDSRCVRIAWYSTRESPRDVWKSAVCDCANCAQPRSYRSREPVKNATHHLDDERDTNDVSCQSRALPRSSTSVYRRSRAGSTSKYARIAKSCAREIISHSVAVGHSRCRRQEWIARLLTHHRSLLLNRGNLWERKKVYLRRARGSIPGVLKHCEPIRESRRYLAILRWGNSSNYGL